MRKKNKIYLAKKFLGYFPDLIFLVMIRYQEQWVDRSFIWFIIYFTVHHFGKLEKEAACHTKST